MNNIEILAPAGSLDILKSAVCAGADAVYIGGSKFGARAFAPNFTEEELLEAIDYVHLHKRKLYLTINTLFKDEEMDELYDYLLPYYQRGLDAVIIQDVGVLDYVRRQFPGLSLHASTQMTVTNAITAEYLEYMGVERVVPAREISAKEVREIADRTNLEIECFVHGALCYCYSGQCLMSSMIGGRSGNRGQCAQPCRLPYQTEGQKENVDIMSLKDLCTVEQIPDLVEAGITSFKIEGRMKQTDYVETVVSMYRKYTDLYLQNGREGFKVTKADKNKLLGAYQRRGYCEGYYFQHNGKNMLSLERPKAIEEQGKETGTAKLQEKIKGEFRISPENNVRLTVRDERYEVTVEGPRAERAVNRPMTAERLEQQLKKTGNTPFVFDELRIDLEGDVFIPIQALNELRREALDVLAGKILAEYRRGTPEIKKEEILNLNDSFQKQSIVNWYDKEEKITGNAEMTEIGLSPIYVSVETKEQLEAVLNAPFVARIYAEDSLFISDLENGPGLVANYKEKAQQSGKEFYLSMTRIFRTHARKQYERTLLQLLPYCDGALVRNMESLLYLQKLGFERPVVADANLYEWNRQAKQFLANMGIVSGTAPVELNYRELQRLGIKEQELIVYGYQPVMVSAGCIRKNTGECTRKSGYTYITDRYHKKFIVKHECVYCYNVIYNTSPLMLLDQVEEISRLEPKALRLQFTVEDAGETRKQLERYTDVFAEGKEPQMPDEDYTRGHFKRGVK